ncbi:MAG: ABC transporter substrate-binding protein [Candidatus Adiutrix sp.]|jgi:iron complex transport system substrate-binding protein|nr:ABC transporter substrate-binding protein [Candidatus Adiutrix sp.]
MARKTGFLVLGLILTLAAQALAAAGTREVRDTSGRPVTIPQEVTRVAPINPAFAQVAEMLTLGGGKIVAYPRMGVSDFFKKVFPDIVRSNPNNYDSGAVEDLIASGAQVVYGPVMRFSEAQQEQLRQAGLAVVPVDVNDRSGRASIEQMGLAFQVIGEILGPEELARAREFVKYYQGNAAEAARRTANLADQDRPRLLQLSTSGGAFTSFNRNSICHQYLTTAGGLNVAADYLVDSGQALTLDPESVVQWDPQYILADSPAAQAEILNNPALGTVDAVKNGRVAVCPYGIFPWKNYSAEGAMLPLWFGTILHPDLFADIDMKTVVRDFFKNYYHYQISAEEIDQVLGGPTQYRPLPE